MARLWRAWLTRRLPPADAVRFGRRNLFIFPSREGGLFLVLLVIMLLTGINYQNSLVYLLTFLLGALYYVGILQTHDNLSGVRLTLARMDDGFVGAPVAVHLRFQAEDRDRPAIRVSLDGQQGLVNLDKPAGAVAELPFSPSRRGWNALPRICVETRYPLGLFKAWSYVWLASPMLAYPRPIEPGAVRQGGRGEDEGQQVHASVEPSDDLLLRPYRVGDPMQRVQWKRYAKDGHKVITEREPMTTDSRWLDYEMFQGVEPELRLSYLSWLVEDCHRRKRIFGLRLPGEELAPGQGPGHRQAALRRLALFGGHSR